MNSLDFAIINTQIGKNKAFEVTSSTISNGGKKRRRNDNKNKMVCRRSTENFE
jgi:hypothetical protein